MARMGATSIEPEVKPWLSVGRMFGLPTTLVAPVVEDIERLAMGEFTVLVAVGALISVVEPPGARATELPLFGVCVAEGRPKISITTGDPFAKVVVMATFEGVGATKLANFAGET